MKDQNNKPLFSTDNFALAIFLKIKNCKLLQINKQNPRRAIFIFEDTPERERLTKDYWEGKTFVEPQSFYNTQRELKTLLYDNSYPVKTLEE